MALNIETPASIDFYPFAYALYNEFLSDYCWYCLDEEQRHLRCSACSVAIFCDKECQRLAWKDHKFECKALKKSPNIPDIEVRLLGRIVARHKAIITGKDKEDDAFYKDRHSRRNIMDVWAHTKNIRNDPYAMQKFTDIYGRLIQFYDSKALLPKDVIFELHCRDFINRHAISDKAYLKEIGKGLYCDLCAYDHSCNQTRFTRVTDFAKQARRKLLKDTWYFNCECERCADNSEHMLTSVFCPQCKENNDSSILCLFGNHEYKDADSQIIRCPKCNQELSKDEVMQALAGMRFIDDLLDKTNFEEMGPSVAIDFLKDLLLKFENMLPKVNIYICRLIQALIPLIDPSDHEQLLKLHLDAEECVRICYPSNHPALAFHLRNIGIFYKSLRQLDMAAKYLQEAKESFEFVMTSEHQLAKSTVSIYLDVKKSSATDKETTKHVEDANTTERNNEHSNAPKLQIQSDDMTENEQMNLLENSKCLTNGAHTTKSNMNADQIFLTVTNSENVNPQSFEVEEVNAKIMDDPSTLIPNSKECNIKSNTLCVTSEENVSRSLLTIKIGENTTPEEPKLKISPSSLSESSGVKKKASLKKFTPRARTPLPPFETVKPDLSDVEDGQTNDIQSEEKCNSLEASQLEMRTPEKQESKLHIENAEKTNPPTATNLSLKPQANNEEKSTKKSKRKNKKH